MNHDQRTYIDRLHAAGSADDQVIVKQKHGFVVVKDKTKPVRRALEAVFAERVRATMARGADALVAQISPDYSVVLPDGQKIGYEWITAYLRRGAEQFLEIKELAITIETIQLNGDEAVVDARQRFNRRQRMADGQVHDVFSTVLQTETWVRTADGWKLKSVADIREQTITVDGEPVDPFKR